MADVDMQEAEPDAAEEEQEEEEEEEEEEEVRLIAYIARAKVIIAFSPCIILVVQASRQGWSRSKV